jgi:biotin transport system substrate-specific component
MNKSATQTLSRFESLWLQMALIVGATFFVALCARITLPLPWTPVPLTLQNFAVLLVALGLGSKRGFAAMTVYLAEGLCGMPVFNPAGVGGFAQLMGPTGGYLLAYPLVAFVVGAISERGSRSFVRNLIACIAGELLLFTGGLAWLAVLTKGAVWQAVQFGLYPFVFAEVAKITAAAGAASRVPRWGSDSGK